ncbi:MAG: LacI family DNA-binding transcriptional regulator [Eubacterium sp.]|nr:LacI family DNA-binding transcriptional regulator [Eubacterium sp.]
MPKKKKVTTRDIASACGLSQTTVSMVLSGREDIHFKEGTVEKVLETARKMGYRYKKRERKPVSPTTKTILIMCPSLSTEYYTTLVRTITKSAKNKGLYTMTTYTMRDLSTEESLLSMAADSGFFGVIYTYAPQAIAKINTLRKQIPFVLINDYNDQLRVPLIELDSRRSGRMIGDHLLSLGHRNIAYMTTPLDPVELPRVRRLDGLKEAFRAAGLDDSLVEAVALTQEQWDYYLMGNRYYDAGYQLTMQYMKRPHKATAFVGTNDQISFGVMDALQKMGYSIPGDYSVCGFDNALASSFEGISLTTIDHSVEEKGAAAVRLLMDGHDAGSVKEDSRSAMLRLEYEPVLLVRKSTGPVAPTQPPS